MHAYKHLPHTVHIQTQIVVVNRKWFDTVLKVGDRVLAMHYESNKVMLPATVVSTSSWPKHLGQVSSTAQTNSLHALCVVCAAACKLLVQYSTALVLSCDAVTVLQAA
jgi:hypothetical protein